MTRATLSEISTSRLLTIMELIDDAFTSDIPLITAAVVIRAELRRRTNGRFNPALYSDADRQDADTYAPSATQAYREWRDIEPTFDGYGHD